MSEETEAMLEGGDDDCDDFTPSDMLVETDKRVEIWDVKTFARKGGQSTSARKKASSRRNGHLGGRPRNPLTPEQIKHI
jgi:hypothetical protein